MGKQFVSTNTIIDLHIPLLKDTTANHIKYHHKSIINLLRKEAIRLLGVEEMQTILNIPRWKTLIDSLPHLKLKILNFIKVLLVKSKNIKKKIEYIHQTGIKKKIDLNKILH